MRSHFTSFSRILSTLSLALVLQTSAVAAQSGSRLSEDILQAENAMIDAWAASPLVFQNTAFISEPSQGFGMFTPRDDAIFEAGEPIVVYAEPIGFGWETGEDGIYRFGYDVDLLVKTATGQVLGGQDNFGEFRFASRSRNREITLTLTLTLDDFPAGDYLVEYRVHDITNAKSGMIVMPFSIVE